MNRWMWRCSAFFIFWFDFVQRAQMLHCLTINMFARSLNEIIQIFACHCYALLNCKQIFSYFRLCLSHWMWDENGKKTSQNNIWLEWFVSSFFSSSSFVALFFVYAAEQISYHISSILIDEYATFWQKGKSSKKNFKSMKKNTFTKCSLVTKKFFLVWTPRRRTPSALKKNITCKNDVWNVHQPTDRFPIL